MLCPHCPNRTFGNIFSLRRHIINIHKIVPEVSAARTNNNKCAQDDCTFSSHTLKQLIEHLARAHDFHCEFDTLNFADELEFENWKQKMEFDTNSLYVKGSGRHEIGGKIFKYFRCHRSGYYQPEAKCTTPRKRKLKVIGTTKIGAVCTSHISYCKSNKGVTATFCKTHYKHSTNEVQFLRLSEPEKLVVMEKLWQGLSIDMIREDLAVDNGDNSLVRPGIRLRRQDRDNIIHQYGLAKNDSSQDDSSSLEAWVTEMTVLGNDSPVRVFKPKGVQCPDLNLGTDDFCLVVMTASQVDLLLKFGTHGTVCIDSSYGLNTDQLEVTTVLTISNEGEVFTVAFLVSNRHTLEMMGVFYEAIKDITGTIQANIFMSDDTEAYYLPWSQIMGDVPGKLLTSWQILIAWRKNLSKIRDKKGRSQVLTVLKNLMDIPEVAELRDAMSETIMNLKSNPRTADFGNYFEECYSNRPELWASSFRQNLHKDSSQNLLEMHKMLLLMYLNGKKNRNLSQTVCAMIKLARDKYSQWESNVSKNTLSARMLAIEESHNQSLKMTTKIRMLSKSKWLVLPEGDDSRSYEIEAKNKSPCCQFQCKECSVCPHMYTCNCPDSVVKLNVCKHMHYLILGLKQIKEKELAMENGIYLGPLYENKSPPSIPTGNVSNPKPKLLPKTMKLQHEKFLKKKAMLKKRLEEYIEMVDSALTPKQLLETKTDMLKFLKGEELPELDKVGSTSGTPVPTPASSTLAATSQTVTIPVVVAPGNASSKTVNIPFVVAPPNASSKTVNIPVIVALNSSTTLPPAGSFFLAANGQTFKTFTRIKKVALPTS